MVLPDLTQAQAKILQMVEFHGAPCLESELKSRLYHSVKPVSRPGSAEFGVKTRNCRPLDRPPAHDLPMGTSAAVNDLRAGSRSSNRSQPQPDPSRGKRKPRIGFRGRLRNPVYPIGTLRF